MSSERRMSKKTLSKHILEMKFMQRTKEKIENEKLEEECKTIFNSELTESMKKAGSRYIIEQSYVPCEDLIFGRMSFKGANPEIEKIMKESETIRHGKEIDRIEKIGSISNEEMADRYSTLIGTISNKFSTKRQRQEMNGTPSPRSRPAYKKGKFIKPGD